MRKKNKKQEAVMVDLSNRKNIRIIESEKIIVSDSEIKSFEQQLEARSKKVDDFDKFYIKKQLKSVPEISDEDFETTMKKMLKQYKILKSLIEEEQEK